MTVKEALTSCKRVFIEAGIETASLDAEVMLAHVLQTERYKVLIEDNKALTPLEVEQFESCMERRSKREPLAYILGYKEFYSLPLKVDCHVLIPRPETELLVDLALYYAPSGGWVLDLCTGSGAIAIALRYNRSDLHIIATDISEHALIIARENQASLLPEKPIEFLQGNLFDAVPQQKFHLIVTNPPYIDPSSKDSLAKELSYEPEHALYAEKNGMAIIEKIIAGSKEYLAEEGILLIEIGSEMADSLQQLADKYGFSVSLIKDYSQKPRVALLQR